MSLRTHPLLFILLPLLVLAVVWSFYRFMLASDYIVAYQGDCDPTMEQCYIAYDDETGESYYYTKVEKYAPDVYQECGADIAGCSDASVCLPTDSACSITYCSPDTVLDDETCAPSESEL